MVSPRYAFGRKFGAVWIFEKTPAAITYASPDDTEFAVGESVPPFKRRTAANTNPITVAAKYFDESPMGSGHLAWDDQGHSDDRALKLSPNELPGPLFRLDIA